jgi:tetratricopeptide (TPR) repeat protein
MSKATQNQIEGLRRQVAEAYKREQFEEGVRLAERVYQLTRELYGEHHLNTAIAMNDMAGMYAAVGNFDAAVPLFYKALDIYRSNLGDRHLHVATSLHNLGILHHSMGAYTKAVSLYLQADEILRAIVEEQHPNNIDNLSKLLSAHLFVYDYAGALAAARRLLDIKRRHAGERHAETLGYMDTVAQLYARLGDYETAESLYGQLLEAYRAAHGEESQAVGYILNSLAVLNYSTGNYARAESLYMRSADIVLRGAGENDPRYANSLLNLSQLYKDLRSFKQAEALALKAQELIRRNEGDDSLAITRALNILALLRADGGRYDEAKTLWRRALEITRKHLPQNHPTVADILNNLATVSFARGENGEAELLFREAMDIYRAALGPRHPHVAGSMSNLSTLYEAAGEYAKAVSMAEQALDIYRGVYGESHPHIAFCLEGLAPLRVMMGERAEALILLRRVNEIYDQLIGEIFSIGSERQRLSYLRRVYQSFDFTLSVILQHYPDSPTAVRSAFDLTLRRKGVVVEAMAAQRRSLATRHDPALKSRFDELVVMRAQLAQKTFAGPGPEGVQAHTELLSRWGHRIETLEAEIARLLPQESWRKQLQSADGRRLAHALPPDSALVEFVKFRLYNFMGTREAGGQPRFSERYVAFVLPAGDYDGVKMVDLGAAEAVERMVKEFRASFTGSGRDLILAEEPEAEGGDGTELRLTVFDPLADALGGRDRLLIAPDGDLALAPFEALPTADGHRLIDTFRISYLGAGRDVLFFDTPFSSPPTEPMVIADPDFDFKDAPPAAAPAREDWRRSWDLRGSDEFTRLPGTRVEGETIAGMLKVEPLLGRAAVESRLRACRSPYILHIATHGFFLPNQAQQTDGKRYDSGSTDALVTAWPLRLWGTENSLLRSGLVLAGANAWLQGARLPAEAEDGFLTAEDVSGLELQATALVVLSACETGLGEVQTGEGVFGLRRAFVLAGAKTLIMSLWKVPDEQTQELMTNFYRHLLGGQSRAEALRNAQLAVKERYPDPLYWGAFICQGDPRPFPEAFTILSSSRAE